MNEPEPPERAAYADSLCRILRDWLERPDSRFELEMRHGVEWCTDGRTQDSIPRANPTLTLTIRFNGGAQDTEGPVIVPTPSLFQPPKEP